MDELKTHECWVYDYGCRADMVSKTDVDSALADKEAEIRRLRRALYKACANWMTNRQVAMACYHLEVRARKFDKAIDKCRAKMEKYK